MLVAITNIPETQQEWDTWSFHHRISHAAIREALQAKGKVTNDYVLDPIYQFDIQGFLQRNQLAHQEMTAAIGAQGSDLQDVDLSNEAQKVAWVYSHWLEHQTEEQVLGISS